LVAGAKTVDIGRVETVLSGKDPFDELTMLDEHDSATPADPKEAVPA
jgi:aerobic C4-dicarboxylate transport protein